MPSWSRFSFASARRSRALGLAITLALGGAALLAPGGCTLNTAGLGGGGSGTTTTTTSSSTTMTATSTSTGTMTCASDDDCGAKVPGSCMKPHCDASVCTTIVDATNTPGDDKNPCTEEACSNTGVPHPPVTPGDACLGMAGFCDTTGNCVPGCTKDPECTTGTTPSCDKGTHTCISCSDGVQNGTETAADCGGKCNECTGGACNKPTDCVSGQCADGVCCNSDCTGACMACNLPGSLGLCSNIPAGQPDMASCGSPQSFSCDGKGVCKTAAGGACNDVNDSTCASGLCFSGSCRLQTNGACTEGSVCASKLCVGGICTDCSTDSQCPSLKCSAPICKAALGFPCYVSKDCATGTCQSYLCKAKDTDPCAHNLDCLSGTCLAGLCAPCTLGSCDGNAVCGSTFGPNTCELPTGAPCLLASTCAAAGGKQCDGFPRKCL